MYQEHKTFFMGVSSKGPGEYTSRRKVLSSDSGAEYKHEYDPLFTSLVCPWWQLISSVGCKLGWEEGTSFGALQQEVDVT